MKMTLTIGPAASGGFYWELTDEGEDIHVGAWSRYGTVGEAMTVGRATAEKFGIEIAEVETVEKKRQWKAKPYSPDRSGAGRS